MISMRIMSSGSAERRPVWLEYEINYDSEPAVEAETTDLTFKLKLGY